MFSNSAKVDWAAGHVSGAVYNGGEEITNLLLAVSQRKHSINPNVSYLLQ